jgi:hypothetical protein
MRHYLSLVGSCALVGLNALAAVGCAGASSDGGRTAIDASELAPWEGAAQEAFGDDIDPAAVGLSMDSATPRSDPLLRERAQTADLVVRVKVTTVTTDAIGEDITYHLGIQAADPPLTSARIAERSFELSIGKKGPSYPVAKAFDSRLRGLTFVAFLRRFAGAEGESTVHWHLAPDTAEVVSAVKEAIALKELSGS